MWVRRVLIGRQSCATGSWRSFALFSVSETYLFLGEANSIDLFFE